MSFNSKLTDLLKTNPNFVDDDGDLLLAAVQDKAWKLDHDLIRLLLSDDDMKGTFFDTVAGSLLFKTNTFIEYISQKNFLDNSYTRFRNRIGLTIDGKYLNERGEVSLAWAYKDCVLEGGQTKDDEKRKEIFFNEVLAQDEINRMFDPKVLTNFTRYTTDGIQVVKELKRDEDGIVRENLIIKGNNLIALHSLEEQYRGKVKLIYIDPPYNTSGDANTFAYNNTFNHSTWLTFISNRIKVAKKLLRPDGVIAIAIDDEEQAYLKVICDEIFDRKNFIGTLVVQSKPSGRTTDAYFATCHEYVLFYAIQFGLPSINFLELTDDQKQEFTEGEGDNAHKWRDFLRTGGYSTPEERPNSFYPIYYNPLTNHISLIREGADYQEVLPIDSNGKKRVWRKTPASFTKHLINGEIQVTKNRKGIYKVKIIDKIKSGRRPKSVWVDSKFDSSSHGTKLLKNLFEGEKPFSFPKSLHSTKDVISLFTDGEGDDIVLDFFAGSGTTGHAVIQLNQEDGGNRQFILCEQMNYAKSVTAERVHKILSDSDFIYCELMEYNQAFVERIQNAENSDELLQIWQDMAQNSFLNWYVNPELPDDAINDFIKIAKEENGLEKQKKLLLELLDKNQLYVNLSEIDDAKFNVSEEDKALNKAFYGKN